MDELMKDLKNNNEKFSDEYKSLMKEYYEKLSSQPNLNKPNPDMPDEEGGLLITPNQSCVIKTSDVIGQKIFINVTTHDKIEAPQEEHIMEMENQLGVRLPMSLSEKYEDFDIKNQICQVYDVIFNTNVVKKTENDPMAFQFMYEVVRERIRQRFSHELKNNFVKLKNLKYKGKYVRQQRVRVKLGPKIQEVINPADKDKLNNGESLYNQHINSKEMSKIVNEKGKTPNWNFIILKDKDLCIENFKLIQNNKDKFLDRKFTLESFTHNISNANSVNSYLFFDESNANPKYGQAFVYIIEMNLISKSMAINITISDEGMIINCPQIYSLNINFPYKICSNEAYSTFETSSRLLFVILPFYEKDCEEFRKINDKQNNKEAHNVNISDDYLFDLVG